MSDTSPDPKVLTLTEETGNQRLAEELIATYDNTDDDEHNAIRAVARAYLRAAPTITTIKASLETVEAANYEIERERLHQAELAAASSRREEMLREACIEKYDVMYCGENGRKEFHRCRLCGNRQDDVPSNMPVNHAQDCPVALSTTAMSDTSPDPLNAACESAHGYPRAVHSKPCSWPECELTCRGRAHRLSARAALASPDPKALTAIQDAICSQLQIQDFANASLAVECTLQEVGRLKASLDAAEKRAVPDHISMVEEWRQELDARIASSRREEMLRETLASAVKVADEARNEWDAAPSGMKAGKLLIALSGHLKGYRPDIDKIHEALSTTPATIVQSDYQHQIPTQAFVVSDESRTLGRTPE